MGKIGLGWYNWNYMRDRLLQKLALFVFLVFILNTAGSFFSWYNLLPWYDNFMHFLGGAWLAMVSVWLLFRLTRNEAFPFFIFISLIFVGTILWEFLEYFVQHVTNAPGALANIPDSISDVIFGMIGGVASLFFIRKKLRAQK